MNNEPVAIVNTNCENNIQWYDDDPKKHNGYFLYTHPAKTITDEEIRAIWHLSDKEIDTWVVNETIVDFARAILRKAQEK
jgi:hypothetical protein